MTIQELNTKAMQCSGSYNIKNFWVFKDDLFALSNKELLNFPYCLVAKYCCLLMAGDIDSAEEILKLFPENSLLLFGCEIVNPNITWKRFIHIMQYLVKNDMFIPYVQLSVGRPSLMNGFNDFTRIWPLFPKYKNVFLNSIGHIYGTDNAENLYDLMIAESYYQKNNLIEAEKLVTKSLKDFDNNKDSRFLFIAYHLEYKILLFSGEIFNSKGYIKQMKAFLKKYNTAEYEINLQAVEMWASLHDNDYEKVFDWYHNCSPDENGNFNMIDTYRYLIKLRCYLLNGEHVALLSLVEKLRPLLSRGRRYMDLCEIDLLLAMSLYEQKKFNEAFDTFERSLKIAKRHKYYRLIGDEGDRAAHLIIDYMKKRGESKFLKDVYEIARKAAVLSPLYLRNEIKKQCNFTEEETDILRLVEQGKDRDEIAELFFISENTVKYHLKKIYSKLGVDSACKAVWKAKLYGIIK